MKNTYNKILISEKYMYKIKDIVKEARFNDGSEYTWKVEFDKENETIDNDGCYHVLVKHKEFCGKIKELALPEWYT